MLHARLRAAAGRDRIPTEGIVAEWTMDSVSGSTLIDTAGSYDATLEGGWSQVAGQVGGAIDFDGDDGAARIGAIPVDDDLQLTGDFTIAFWVNSSDSGYDFQRIIDKSDSGNGANGWSFWIPVTSSGPDGQISISINGTNINYTTWNGPVIDFDSWTFIVYTVSGSTISGYKNGTLVDTYASFPSRPNIQTNCAIATWNHSTGRELKGALDQMRIYSRALTSDEVEQLYNEGA